MDRKHHVSDNASALTRLLESVKKNVTRISNMMSADMARVSPEFLDVFPYSPKDGLELVDAIHHPQFLYLLIIALVIAMTALASTLLLSVRKLRTMRQ